MFVKLPFYLTSGNIGKCLIFRPAAFVTQLSEQMEAFQKRSARLISFLPIYKRSGYLVFPAKRCCVLISDSFILYLIYYSIILNRCINCFVKRLSSLQTLHHNRRLHAIFCTKINQSGIFFPFKPDCFLYQQCFYCFFQCYFLYIHGKSNCIVADSHGFRQFISAGILPSP